MTRHLMQVTTLLNVKHFSMYNNKQITNFMVRNGSGFRLFGHDSKMCVGLF